MQKFMLNIDAMSSWPLVLWALFTLIFLSITYVAVTVILTYYRLGILLRYIILVSILSTIFWITTFLLRDEYSVHIHHYTVGMIFVCLLGH
jgi:hypothetical protein